MINSGADEEYKALAQCIKELPNLVDLNFGLSNLNYDRDVKPRYATLLFDTIPLLKNLQAIGFQDIHTDLETWTEMAKLIQTNLKGIKRASFGFPDGGYFEALAPLIKGWSDLEEFKIKMEFADVSQEQFDILCESLSSLQKLHTLHLELLGVSEEIESKKYLELFEKKPGMKSLVLKAITYED